MTRRGVGEATEAAVLSAFVSCGYEVLLPFGGARPYDLLVEVSPRDFLRVQCKTGRGVDGCVAFNCCRTDHGKGRRQYRGLADVFGVYYAPARTIYLVPVGEVPGFAARLRLGPTANNQRTGVRFAADYEFETWTRESLGELTRRGREETATPFA